MSKPVAVEPDEPTFTLLGRDPVAPLLVWLWAEIRTRLGEERDVVDDARAIGRSMEAWARTKGRGERIVAVHEAFEKILENVFGEQASFANFAAMLRDEARWSSVIHSSDKTGQAGYDQTNLRELADHVERVGKSLGFM